MASTSTDNSFSSSLSDPCLAAASAAPGSPNSVDRIEPLNDDIIPFETIPTSLEDSEEFPERQTQIASTKRALALTQREIRLVGGAPPLVNEPSASARMDSNGATGFQQAYAEHPPSHTISTTSTPSTMSESSDSSPLALNQSGYALPSRKRSLNSSHLSAYQPGRAENKSRRTTPSPMVPSPRPPADDIDFDFADGMPVIDLTGDDDSWKEQIAKQKREMQRSGRLKAERDRNEALGRQMCEKSGPRANTGYDTTLTSRSSQSSQPNAFDMMMSSSARQPNWPGQSSQAGVKLEHNPGFSHGQTSYGAPVKQETPFASASGNYLSTSRPGAHQVKREPSTSDFRVPGAYVDSDDSDELLGTSASFTPRHTTSQDTRPRPSFPTTAGHFDWSNPSLPPLEQARQTSLAGSNGQFTTALGHYSTTLTPMASPFAGYMGSDPSNPFDLTGDTSRPGYSLNGHPYHQESLASLTKRVNEYDWTSMADGYGNPLNSNVVDYINDLVDDPRKTAEDIQKLLSNIRPDMDIPLEERGETPEALKYPLYTHQQVALKWMTDMEEGSNKGGILADDMGLGKTISTLAIMASRRSSTNIKTNLVIGPVALIKQWEVEIGKKLKSGHKLSVFLLHGKKANYAKLKTFDVVLTTYGSVASEWKRFEKHVTQARKNVPGYEPALDVELEKKCPILHPRSKFYRIILDEAQCIKNKDTQASQGVHHIDATYRWCLTGTPMMNGVTELYALIRFLGIKPFSEHKNFSNAFKSLSPKAKSTTDYQRSDAMKKLQAVLKAIMLRRMKNSKIDGKPILTLPDKTENSEHVVFSEDEKSFYTELESRTQVQFNKYLRAGTVGKNYHNILVLLLRLRQACCHPHLMDFECVSTNEASEEQMMALAKSLDSSVIDRVKAIEAFECPICYDATSDPTLLIPCGHDTCSECFASLTDKSIQNNIRSGNDSDAAKCPVCRGPVEPTKIISYTIFQKAHMPESIQAENDPAGELEAPEDSDEDSSDSDSETASEADESDVDSKGNLLGFVVSDEGDDEELDRKSSMKKKKKKKKKSIDKKNKGKKKAEEIKPQQLASLRQEANKNRDARRRYMHYLRDNWEDSAKVTKVVELLQKIQESDEKTIIFSQWTSLLDLIECQIKYKLDLKYCRYTGGMSRSHRDEAVRDFVENPRNKVMLVSLRAGNAGLNLTVASRIIIMDPFWNPYIEMQAVDRAHRIGQQREVTVHRILVQETVEDRIIDLQERKREIVEAALDEGESSNLGRLSERELAFLFGVRG